MKSTVQLPTRLLRRLQLCQRCDLYTTRKRVVPGRGVSPADVMFIGIGPGESENLRGLAFIGPTKPIIDSAIQLAAEWADMEVPSVFLANLVCCRPWDVETGRNRDPSGEEAWACYQNLRLVHREVDPKLVITLGKVPTMFCREPFPESVALIHPAYLLRVGGARSPAFKGFVRRMSDAFKLIRGQTR